jgi:hypothetical protein
VFTGKSISLSIALRPGKSGVMPASWLSDPSGVITIVLTVVPVIVISPNVSDWYSEIDGAALAGSAPKRPIKTPTMKHPQRIGPSIGYFSLSRQVTKRKIPAFAAGIFFRSAISS